MTYHFHQVDTPLFLPLQTHSCSLFPTQTTKQIGTAPHLSILMVNKDIPSAVVLQIGYLQAMGSADFSWLESGIHSIDLHDCFGLSGLQKGNTF